MTRPLQRAKQLAAKAVDPATPEEEARTTALIAIKLIVQHKMLDELEEVEAPSPSPWGPEPWPGSGPAPHGAAPSDFEAFWEQFMDVIGRPGAPFPGSTSGRRPQAGQPGYRPPGRPWRGVEPSYPGGRPRTAQQAVREDSGPWWDRLPCELVIYSDRTCEVCGKTCEAGEVVWAYQLVKTVPNGGTRPRVAHLRECRDRLPPQHRAR